MKEADFIKQNRSKWERFERLSGSTQKDPEELSELFIELTNDLSYARTHYPRRTVRVYLNNLAQQVFQNLYKKSRAGKGTFLKFWRHDLPLEMYQARRALLVSFMFFAVSAIIGAFSTSQDISFARVILGTEYVDMTEANINMDDPMAVYKQDGKSLMFLRITINNIQVSFLAFILGIFMSLGTLYLLVKNGIMLGTFQYFFHAKGLLLTSFLTIWIHGALEISAIVIAGAAGITLGNGLLFRGSYTLGQSLYLSAKRGIRIMIGLVPVFIIAGFLEGFVTRKTEMPDALKWIIILGSFAFIFWYFVLYPRLKYRKQRIEEPPVTRFNAPDTTIELYRTGQNAGLFAQSFRLLGQVFSVYWKSMLVLLFLGLGIWTFETIVEGKNKLFYMDSIQMLHGQFNIQDSGSIYAWLWVLWFSLIALFAGRAAVFTLKKHGYLSEMKAGAKYIFIRLIPAFALILMFASVLGWMPFRAWWILPFLLHPLFYVNAAIMTMHPFSLKAITKAVQQSFRSYSVFLGNMLGLLLVALALFILLIDPFQFNFLTQMVTDVLQWHLLPQVNPFLMYNTYYFIGFAIFILLTIPAVLSLGIVHLYSSIEEDEGIGLAKRVEEFGKVHNRYE